MGDLWVCVFMSVRGMWYRSYSFTQVNLSVRAYTRASKKGCMVLDPRVVAHRLLLPRRHPFPGARGGGSDIVAPPAPSPVRTRPPPTPHSAKAALASSDSIRRVVVSHPLQVTEEARRTGDNEAREREGGGGRLRSASWTWPGVLSENAEEASSRAERAVDETRGKGGEMID